MADPPNPTHGTEPPTVPYTPASPEAAHAGERLGPYKLLSVIGEGGFGVVWLAERREPFTQRVAIKIIKAGMDSATVIARFEQERQALAVMDHPNIARVLDGGITPPELGSRPFFVMEYIKGEPITQYCDRQELSIRERLELFTAVCEAVQHAHMKGIIHRDLKPGNILIKIVDSAAGLVPGVGAPEHVEATAGAVHGALPKVIDFGVAKAVSRTLTEKTIFTELGQMIGTPEYMSPEQAEMGPTDIDTRTDIYSLGVVLYELLSGALPFDRETLRKAAWATIVDIIRNREPPKPSTKLSSLGDTATTVAARRKLSGGDSLVRELRDELDWITLKAMEKDRVRRYSTAAEFAEDIRSYLSSGMVRARRATRSYRFRKFVKRNQVLAGTTTVVAVALVAGLATSLSMLRRAVVAERNARHQEGVAVAEKARAETGEAKAKENETLAKRSAYEANIAAAGAMISDDNSAPALKRLEECPPELRGWEWRHLRQLADGSAASANINEPLWQGRFSSDGSQVFVCGLRNLYTLNPDLSRKDVWNFGREDPTYCFTLIDAHVSRDGKRVLAVLQCDGQPPRVVLFERNAKVRHLTEGRSLPSNLDWTGSVRPQMSDDGATILIPVQTQRGLAAIWHDGDQVTDEWDLPEGSAALAISRNAAFCIVAVQPPAKSGKGSSIQFFSRKGQLIREEPTPFADSQRVRALAIGSDGRQVGSCGDFGLAWLADAGAAPAVSRDDPSRASHQHCRVNLSLDPASSLLAVGIGVTLSLHSEAQAARSLLRGHTHAIVSTDINSDGSMAVSCGSQGDVRLWKTRPDVLATSTATMLAVPSAQDRGAVVAIGSVAGATSSRFALFDAATRSVLPAVTIPLGAVVSAAVSYDTRRLALLTTDGVTLIDAASGSNAYRKSFLELGISVSSAADLGPVTFAPGSNDTVILTVKAPNNRAAFMTLNTTSGDVRTLTTLLMLDDNGPAESVYSSPPSSKAIAFVSYTGIVLCTAPEHARVIDGEFPPGPIALSPSGHRLAVLSYDNRLTTYDAETGAKLAVESAHSATGTALTWLGEDRIATAGADGTLMIWTADPLRPLMTEPALHPTDTRPVAALAFDPGSQVLLAARQGSREVHFLSAPAR